MLNSRKANEDKLQLFSSSDWGELDRRKFRDSLMSSTWLSNKETNMIGQVGRTEVLFRIRGGGHTGL